MRYTANRWGATPPRATRGSTTPRNRASDWFFFNIPEDNPTPRSAPRRLVRRPLRRRHPARRERSRSSRCRRSAGRPKDRVKRWGFSVAKYGAAAADRVHRAPAAPPGASPTRATACGPRTARAITGNDPADTSVADRALVRHRLDAAPRRPVRRPRRHGGVRFYALDNEPCSGTPPTATSIPQPADLRRVWARTLRLRVRDQGSRTRRRTSSAPSIWGWCAYFFSAADDCSVGPDRTAHGGPRARSSGTSMQVEAAPATQPACGSSTTSTSTTTRRRPASPSRTTSRRPPRRCGCARSRASTTPRTWTSPGSADGTRCALDPARLQEWIAARCPGTKLAITEYNWGDDDGHQQRARPGRGAGHLRPRGGGPRDPLGGARRTARRIEDAFSLFLELRRRRRPRPGPERARDELERGPGGRLRGRLRRRTSSTSCSSTRTPRRARCGDGGREERPARFALYRFTADDPARERGQGDAVRRASSSLTLPARSATPGRGSPRRSPARPDLPSTRSRPAGSSTRGTPAGDFGGPALAALVDADLRPVRPLRRSRPRPGPSRSTSPSPGADGCRQRGPLLRAVAFAPVDLHRQLRGRRDPRQQRGRRAWARGPPSTARANQASGTVHLIVDVNGYFQ